MSYRNFTVETDDDGIALVTWDMPDKSMNVFTMEVMDEMEKIIGQVCDERSDQGRRDNLRQEGLLRRRGSDDAEGHVRDAGRRERRRIPKVP